MANTVIFSKKNLAPLIFETFSYLQEKNLVVSLFRYATETTPNSGKEDERLIKLDDGNGHKLTGLFLKASKESVLERNARRAPRWFEKPFVINGQEYYLSSQWNASGDFQLTLPVLNHFLKKCCKNESDGSTFSIYKNGDEFVFAQGDFNLNDDEQQIIDKPEESEPSNKLTQKKRNEPFQTIFFGAPGTGKSFKVNSILGEERKRSFSKSDHAKSNGYTKDLCNVENVGFNVWPIDNIGFLEKKLVSFELDNKVTNSRHSALRAYIDFFKKYREENRENRTTFHPDYDYAQFVGAYKPKKIGDTITYSFVPQVFAKAYAAAWRLYLKGDSRLRGNDNEGHGNDGEESDIRVFLVIEEINRGNCAQIFGDIFQLLDRDSDGFSQYAIDADCDFADWLENNDAGLKSVWDKYKGDVGEGKLKLPPNLNILATMNTSDQSLFPMDSAFKRRFDWEYVPISFEGKEAANYQIDIDGSQYPWQEFVETVNEKILDLTESEDKQLGEFFIKPDSGDVISKERFLGKVMFYLWNEVCKDEHKNGSFFRVKTDSKEEYFTFQDLYKKEKSGYLKQFMDELLKKE